MTSMILFHIKYTYETMKHVRLPLLSSNLGLNLTSFEMDMMPAVRSMVIVFLLDLKTLF